MFHLMNAPRSRHHAVLRSLFFYVLITVLASCGIAPGQPFELVDLGVLPGDLESGAADINEDGVIVGSSSSGLVRRAFIWRNGNVSELPGLDGPGVALAISDSCTVAGWSRNLLVEQRAVIWRDGVVQDLGDIVNNDSISLIARAINASDQIVGDANSSSAGRAFFWEDDVMSEISGSATLNGLNDAGDIVGSDQNTGKAILVTDAGVTQLGSLNEPDGFSTASDINASRQVVGFSQSGGETEAFLWTESAGMTGLGDLPGGIFSSRARAINTQGTIVGRSEATNGTIAFIWDAAEGMRDLNDLMDDSATGWEIQSASGINDQYEISGTALNPAGQRRAVLLRAPTIDLRLVLDLSSTTATIHYPTLKPIGDYHLHVGPLLSNLTNAVNRSYTIAQNEIELMSHEQRATATFQLPLEDSLKFFTLVLEP